MVKKVASSPKNNQTPEESFIVASMDTFNDAKLVLTTRQPPEGILSKSAAL